MGEKTLKEIDEHLSNSFSRIKEDITSLKKSRKFLTTELNELNLKQLEADKNAAKDEDLHKMRLKVEKVSYEQKSVKEFSAILAMLQKDAVMRSEFQRQVKNAASDIDHIKKDVTKLKKSREVVKESRIKNLENSLLKVNEVRDMFLKDVRNKYLDADEVASEINPLKREFLDLYNKVNKIKKEVLNFQRSRFIANICLVIALISFIGAATALGFNYVYVANFLGIETLIFLIIAFVIKAGIAVRK